MVYYAYIKNGNPHAESVNPHAGSVNPHAESVNPHAKIVYAYMHKMSVRYWPIRVYKPDCRFSNYKYGATQ